MPIVIAADNHVEREKQAIDICDPHCDRVVVCTPTKLVVLAKTNKDWMTAATKLREQGFDISTHIVGGNGLIHIEL